MSFLRRNAQAIDTVSKVGGVCLAVFWVAQYTIDVVRSDRQSARNESISYIKRFSEDDILDARMELLNFWKGRERLASMAVTGSISSQNYGYVLLKQLDSTPQAQGQLKRLGYFFDELYYCYVSDICDHALVESFFCPHAIGNESSYFQFLRESDARLVGRDLYLGVKELARLCQISNS